MQYEKEIILKDGAKCLLRGAGEADAAEVLRTFDLTHAETDYFLTYPEENSFTVQEEAKFLKARSESKNAIEIAAFVDARIAGTAGIDPIDDKEKIRHRADFGIAIEKAYWGRGIGKALTLACIECAKQAGYLQIELEVVAEKYNIIRKRITSPRMIRPSILSVATSKYPTNGIVTTIFGTQFLTDTVIFCCADVVVSITVPVLFSRFTLTRL
mgnify:CR=1 FL=1